MPRASDTAGQDTARRPARCAGGRASVAGKEGQAIKLWAALSDGLVDKVPTPRPRRWAGAAELFRGTV